MTLPLAGMGLLKLSILSALIAGVLQHRSMSGRGALWAAAGFVMVVAAIVQFGIAPLVPLDANHCGPRCGNGLLIAPIMVGMAAWVDAAILTAAGGDPRRRGATIAAFLFNAIFLYATGDVWSA